MFLHSSGVVHDCTCTVQGCVLVLVLRYSAFTLLSTGVTIQEGRHCSLEDARATMSVWILGECALRRLPASAAQTARRRHPPPPKPPAPTPSAQHDAEPPRQRTLSEHSLFEDHYWPDCDADGPADSAAAAAAAPHDGDCSSSCRNTASAGSTDCQGKHVSSQDCKENRVSSLEDKEKTCAAKSVTKRRHNGSEHSLFEDHYSPDTDVSPPKRIAPSSDTKKSKCTRRKKSRH